MKRHSDDLAKSIVMQHAEGSALLSAGRFEIDGDLFADDETADDERVRERKDGDCGGV